MTKTIYRNLENVYEDFFNSVYYTNGGHKHDGVDLDGHCSKVDLTNGNHVQGVLPIGMLPSHSHSSGGTIPVKFSGDTISNPTGTVGWLYNFQAVHLYLPDTQSESSTISLKLHLDDSVPGNIWPDIILVNGVRRQPILVWNEGQLFMGAITLPQTNTGALDVYVPNRAANGNGGLLSLNGFTNSGFKGIASQSISYVGLI